MVSLRAQSLQQREELRTRIEELEAKAWALAQQRQQQQHGKKQLHSTGTLSMYSSASGMTAEARLPLTDTPLNVSDRILLTQPRAVCVKGLQSDRCGQALIG